MTSSPASTETSPPPPRDRRWLSLLIRYRLVILILLHTLLFAMVYGCAFLMRFTLAVPDRYVALFWKSLPVIVAIKLGVFIFLSSFHGWCRHVNFSDIISIVRSSLIATLAIIAFDVFLLPEQIPRTILLNDLVVTIVIVGGLRSLWRVWDERILPLNTSRKRERGLMVGNDVDVAKMAHLINSQYHLDVRIVGMVAPSHYRKGQRFSDVRVVGPLEALPRLMHESRATILFVIAGSIPARTLRQLLDTSANEDFRIRIIPQLSEQLRGTEQLPIRKVAFEDLLHRDPVKLDMSSIDHLIRGKTILVTGAGGSIGSELCRQLVRFQPQRLVLLGRGENRIYQIERELRAAHPEIDMVPRIASITDSRRVDEIFQTFRPQLVFHAAAHKHVPLVEQNVGEAIINNILGTKVMAQASDRHGVDRFVMVSTDKAVHPTSLMGCTKQMAERYCQALGERSSTKFIATRFGNVLGSAGSVVPLFQEQIAQGGPITITDRRMTRYFMTIPEASQLVIQAAAIGKGNEIFVLEMGEPVKIIDLARDLIRLAGHSPESIDIVECGIRPGEKLYEELYYENEESLPTSHEKILSSYSRPISWEEVNGQVDRLIQIAYGPANLIRKEFKKVIPEYQDASSPSNSQPVDHPAPTMGQLT